MVFKGKIYFINQDAMLRWAYDYFALGAQVNRECNKRKYAVDSGATDYNHG